MTWPRRLVWHTISLGASGLLSRSAIVLIGFLVARYFGPQEFGRYATALALATLFLTLSNIGVSFNLMRLTARDNEGLAVAYGNTLFITGVLAVVLYSALVVTSDLLDYPKETQRLVWLLGPVVILLSFHEVFSAIAQGRELMGRISIFRVTYAISLLISILVVVWLNKSLEVFCLIALIAVVCVTLTWLFATNSLVKPQLSIGHIPKMLRASYLYGLSAFFFVIYFRIDTVMLSLLRSTTEVGEYNAAYQVIELFIKAPALVSFVTMPFAFSVADQRARTRAVYHAKVRHLGVMGGLCTIAVFILAEPILSATVGAQYRSAPAALQILSSILIFKFLAVAAGDTLTALDRQGIRTTTQGIVAAVNITLNLLLIPRWGIMGAAWATVASEALLAMGYYVSVGIVWGGDGVFRLLAYSFLSLAIGGLIAAASYGPLGSYVAVICGGIAVLGLAFALGLLRREDLKALLSSRQSG